MADVWIRGLTLLRPAPGPDDTNLASFSCSVGPVIVSGANLRRFKGNKVLAVLPQCRERHCGFRFAEHGTQTAVTDAAVAAYVAAGGILPADDA